VLEDDACLWENMRLSYNARCRDHSIGVLQQVSTMELTLVLSIAQEGPR